MRIYQTKDYQEMSRRAADLISAQILLKPDAVLGLATGSSPLKTYELLVERYQKGLLDFSGIRTVNLDEYIGLPASHPKSYAHFMQAHLFAHVNIRPEHTFIPNGMETDAALECGRYNSLIKNTGGIDLQLLGIGNNGHIGFNEPGSAFIMDTHRVKLAESTILANARFFPSADEVPKYAYSAGIRQIMQADKILLLASGKSKAEALYEAFYGPVSPALPASILQLHKDVTIAADEDALSLINEKRAAGRI